MVFKPGGIRDMQREVDEELGALEFKFKQGSAEDTVEKRWW